MHGRFDFKINLSDYIFYVFTELDGNVISIGVKGRGRCSQMKTDPAIFHGIMHNSVMQEKT